MISLTRLDELANISPERRAKCEAFTKDLVAWIEDETKKRGFDPSDAYGAVFGIGLGSAFEGGATADDICNMIRGLANVQAQIEKSAEKGPS